MRLRSGSTLPMRPDGVPDFHAITRKMAQVAMLIQQNMDLFVDNPEAEAVLKEVDLATRTLEMEMTYLRTLDRVTGDLPRIARRFGSTPRPTGSFQANAGTFVYVAYDDHDKVIYVGITDDLFGRMAAHRSSKRWWPQMERLEWEEWPDRQAALRKESILIRRYRPRFNIAGNPDARKGDQ